MPAQKGDVFNITNSPGAHEKEPAWSPNGRSIAYFSDASGEYELHIANQDGSGEPKIIKLEWFGILCKHSLGTDSKKLGFVDNGRRLYVTEIASGKTIKIAEDAIYSPGSFRDLFGSWSSDGNHIAYTTITETNFQRAWMYSLPDAKSNPVTDALSNVTEPIFDPSGKYLYLLASTDAGPVVNWFDLSNQDMEATNSIYLVTLQKMVQSPFAKENEIEEIKDSTTAKAPYKADSSRTKLKIDWDGIENRIIPFPLQKEGTDR
jgi:tricorn protease